MNFPFIDLRLNLESFFTEDFFKAFKKDWRQDLYIYSIKNLETVNASVLYSKIISDVKDLAKIINSKKDFENLCSYALKKLKKKNSLYTEIHFSPQLYSINEFSANEQLLLLISSIKKFDITAKVIINFIRGNGVNSALAIFNHLNEIDDEELRFWFRGISLGGINEAIDITSFEKLFRNAHDNGLKTSSVSGIELKSSQEIWDNIFSLQIDRIAYGHNIQKDSNLMRYFRVTQSPIEISANFLSSPLLSNDKSNHLYYEFYNSGLNTVFVTDFSDLILMNENLMPLLKRIGFSDENLDDILVFNPINASFLSKFERGNLLEKALNILR